MKMLLQGFGGVLLLCSLASCSPFKPGGHHSGEEHGGDQGHGGEALETLLRSTLKALNGSLSPAGIAAVFGKCNLSGLDFPRPAQPINISFAEFIGQPPYSLPSIIAKIQQILNVTREQILSKGAEVLARCKDVLPAPGGGGHDAHKSPSGGEPGPGGEHPRSRRAMKPKPSMLPMPHKSPEPGSHKSPEPGSHKSPEPGSHKSHEPDSHKGSGPEKHAGGKH